jgi:hypothetical protein
VKDLIYKGGFSVVYVGYDCYVSDFHWAAKVRQLGGAF